MNLYKIMFEHYAQKGSKRGISTYLAASNDEEVYEWLKIDHVLSDGENIWTTYASKEDEGEVFDIYDNDYNVVGQESYKDRIIRFKGDMFDDENELHDLYYGLTLYGWELIMSNISLERIDEIKSFGINIEIVGESNG